MDRITRTWLRKTTKGWLGCQTPSTLNEGISFKTLVHWLLLNIKYSRLDLEERKMFLRRKWWKITMSDGGEKKAINVSNRNFADRKMSRKNPVAIRKSWCCARSGSTNLSLLDLNLKHQTSQQINKTVLQLYLQWKNRFGQRKLLSIHILLSII